MGKMNINYDDYPNDRQLRVLCLLYHEEGREVTPQEVIEFCVVRANHQKAGQVKTPKTCARHLILNKHRLALWDHYHNAINKKG